MFHPSRAFRSSGKVASRVASRTTAGSITCLKALFNQPAFRSFSTSGVANITSSGSAVGQSSVNAEEIAFFSRLSSLWWDEKGEYGQLHRMNPERVKFIKEKLLEVAREEQGEAATAHMESGGKPLAGLDVLDVGCGGGLLSESLTRLGAQTTAIDASSSNIAIATTHAAADPELSGPRRGPKFGTLRYINAPAETLLEESQRFDVVCSLEVIEHVDNPAQFLRTCSELVKPGGHLFLSSIARTPFSYLSTILVAEKLLNLVSEGTHTHSKYVNPEEFVEFFSNYQSTPNGKTWISQTHQYNQTVAPSPVPSRQEAEVRGLIWEPFRNIWHLAPRSASYGLAGLVTKQCNYIFWVRKPVE